MDEPTCPLCRGPLAPCVMITGNAGAPVIYSAETKFFSVTGRKYHSALDLKVCVDCGYVMSFAVNPGVFREALGGEKGRAAGLPIPHSPVGDGPGEGAPES